MDCRENSGRGSPGRRVSVVVPVYRSEPYLRQCVDSLVHQTYRDLEIILVDDGSPDDCPQICDEYAAQDPRVRVIHQINGGPASARRAGAEMASGDCVLFVDGDDWLDRETLTRCVDALQGAPDTECVIFSYVREYPQRSMTAHVLDGTCLLRDEEAEDRVYRRLFGLIGDELRHPERLENMGSCCMKLYRRDLVDRGRFFDTAEVGSSEDALFNLYALYGCRRIIYLDEPLYHYRKTGDSITSRYRPQLIGQWGRLFAHMEAFLEEERLGPAYREALDSRIALSVLGIGSNELQSEDGFFAKVDRIRGYICSERYSAAVARVSLGKMPLPWKAMLFFAKKRLALLVSLELAAIQRLRRSF